MNLKKYREQVLTLSYDYWKSQVLHTSVRLGVFEALGKKRRSLRQIALRLKLNPRATGMLLRAMGPLNLLRQRGNSFENTAAGRKIFLKGEKFYVGDIVALNAGGWGPWGNLEHSIRTGCSQDLPPFFSQGYKAVEGFIMAMDNTAKGHADQLAERLPLTGKKSLLDVGGGSGAFALAFLKRNPKLQATLFDLPLTVKVARKLIKKEGLLERFRFQERDFLKKPIQGQFDVVFLSHIIHGLDEKSNRILLEKIYQALNPGGWCIIQDFFLDASMTAPVFAALFSLNMLIHTPRGRSYSASEMMSTLRRIGFKRVQQRNLQLPRAITLVTAVKR